MPSDYLPHSPADSHHMDAAWGRSVVDSQRRSRVRAGAGLVIRTTRNGTVVAAKPTRVFRAVSDGSHPFKVLDASDANGPKVRVLPGICNFSFPTVGGLANDITDAADHAANAPRLAITETCFVAIIPDGIAGPLPAALDIGTITSPVADPAGVPLAKVTVKDGVITEIYQLVFDIVGLAALDYGPAFGVSYAVTR